MTRRLSLFVLLFVFAAFLVSTGHPGSIEAQSPPGPPKGKLDFASLAGDLHLPGKEQPQRSAPSDASGALDYSRVAYMSLRDNNWEIYTQEGLNGSKARRTHHGADDVFPRLNRGATQIVFASDRDGDFEIFTMDRWGNNIRQLTFNGVTDTNPSWSYDSRTILFESDRDGQAEIYSMKADGSGLKRLTYDGAYDGDASLSPDGSQIVFTSRRNGYGIWIMKSDGSNPRQIAWNTYSQNPVWSPDGSKIAYDADATGNGWQEIWTMKPDGSGKKMIWQSGDTYDPYVRSWSPDGRYIAFTLVDWVFYNGRWYWYSARPYYVQATSGGYASTLVYDQDREWYPDWQSTDVEPPRSSVLPLPEYSRDDAIVRWSGSDDNSGIQDYDIQYRIGREGAWQDWHVNTSSTQSTFSKLPGETVYFRSRATDRAGSEESWPAYDGDALTTFYNWAISGTVMDNRLVPIAGVTVSTTQQIFEHHPSDASGAYSAYFDGYDSAYQIDLLKAGYGSLPTGNYSIAADAHLDALLPPADNIVADPGFESPTALSGSWQAGGGIAPQLSTETSHTGQQSVFLGQPFDLEVLAQFDADPNFTNKPGPKLDAAGAFHLVWYQGSTGNDKEIYYAQGDGDGNWTEVVTINPAPTNIRGLLWDVSPDGRVHVVWDADMGANDYIYHLWRDDAGWHGPTIVYNIGRVYLYALRADSQNGAHLLWRLDNTSFNDTYYSQVNAAGAWSSPDRLYVPYDTEAYNLVLDKEDVVHLQWNYSGDDLLHNYRRPDGSWSERELVAPGGYNWYNDLLIDDNNGVHLVWGNVSSGKIYHAKRRSDGSWSSAYVSAGTGGDPHTLEAAAGPDGTLVLGWKGDSSSCRQPYVAFIDSQGVWTGTRKLDPGSDCVHYFWFQRTEQQLFLYTNQLPPGTENHFCMLALGDSDGSQMGQCAKLPVATYSTNPPQPLLTPGGMSHIFWRTRGPDGISELVHSRVIVNETAASSRVWQEVAIPPVLLHPTLSFVYWQPNPGQSPMDGLSLSVEDGLGSTVVFSGTSTAGWQYQSIDLAAWSGQTVTLTFELRQSAGDTGLWAYLDEVYLGSAYPDTWLALTYRGSAVPGNELALNIAYGNRSSASATEGEIILTLPPELSFVGATPGPTTQNGTLTWDVGTLAQSGGDGSIAVTVRISDTIEDMSSLPVMAELQCATPELNMDNNSLQLNIRLGGEVLIPIIIRP